MSNPGRLLIGLLLLLAGVLFLFDVAGYVDAWEIVETWWPLALIGFGVASLIGPARSLIGGSIVTAIGAIMLVSTLDFLPVDAAELFLPLVLIAVGLGIIFVRAGHRASDDPDNSINSFAMFGGQEIVSRANRFAGGSLTAIFGGASLDLRQARLDPSGAGVETFAAFGGIDIVVPRGWRVAVSGMPLFGAFEDKTDRSLPSNDDAPTLRVSGVVLFGGVEVSHEPD